MAEPVTTTSAPETRTPATLYGYRKGYDEKRTAALRGARNKWMSLEKTEELHQETTSREGASYESFGPELRPIRLEDLSEDQLKEIAQKLHLEYEKNPSGQIKFKDEKNEYKIITQDKVPLLVCNGPGNNAKHWKLASTLGCIALLPPPSTEKLNEVKQLARSSEKSRHTTKEDKQIDLAKLPPQVLKRMEREIGISLREFKIGALRQSLQAGTGGMNYQTTNYLTFNGAWGPQLGRVPSTSTGASLLHYLRLNLKVIGIDVKLDPSNPKELNNGITQRMQAMNNAIQNQPELQNNYEPESSEPELNETTPRPYDPNPY